MSFRTDSGVCTYCGAVMELAQLTRLEGDEGAQGASGGETANRAGVADDYVCPDCGGDGDGGGPGASPGVA